MPYTFEPLFLISLPRSGSTLFHKILATCPLIATANEPWIALPFAYMRNRSEVDTPYWQHTGGLAIEEFVSGFPNGEEDFNALCNEFIMGAYAKYTHPDAKYFLDKTPRYYLIVDFLEKIFPNAKFIFLFRHPLDVLNSVFNTWHRNRFTPNLRGSAIDIWAGPTRLAKAYNKDNPNHFKVNYQELVQQPHEVISRLSEFTKLPFESFNLEGLGEVSFSGTMGDPTKGQKYQGVDPGSLETWPRFVTNRFRNQFVERYVQSFPPEVWAEFGVDRQAVLDKLSSLPKSYQGYLMDSAGFAWYRAAVWMQHCNPKMKKRFRPLPTDLLLPRG